MPYFVACAQHFLFCFLAKKQNRLLKAFASKAESVAHYRAVANNAKFAEAQAKAEKEAAKALCDRAQKR